jgi:hypothetical protein
VTDIEWGAFLDCSALTAIYNHAAAPQAIDYPAFLNVDKSACTLYVPAIAADAYKAADVWKEFINIAATE